MLCPCKDCKKRYRKVNSEGQVIGTCHSECPLYKAYDEENKKIRELRFKKNQETGAFIDQIMRFKRKK